MVALALSGLPVLVVPDEVLACLDLGPVVLLSVAQLAGALLLVVLVYFLLRLLSLSCSRLGYMCLTTYPSP